MLQYILTALAGIALGVVAMRIWQSQGTPAGDSEATGAATGGEMPAPAANFASPSTRTMLVGAGVLVAAAVALFVLRSPDEGEGAGPAPALAAGSNSASDLADVDTMIDRLAKRLKENPDDGEGFRMLGWSYVMTGRPQQALAPYKRAIELQPERAAVHAGYGEALVAVAGDKVTPEAKVEIDKALSLDPAEPRARHFAALWKAQNGMEKAALEEWIALSNGAAADAPWQADVRRRIDQTAGKLGIDVSKRLKHPAPADAVAGTPAITSEAAGAISAMPAADRAQMVDGMVEGLAAKLKANPANADGWVMLLRSRMVLKQADRAGKDLAAARAALAGDRAGLAAVNAAAGELGVPGA